MKQYLDLLKTILDKGVVKESGRAGMPNTRGIFCHQMRFDLSEGFPLLTTKKMPFKTIAHELIWFLKGETNIKYLVDNGCNIWNGDAYRYFKNKFPDVAPHKTMEQFLSDVKDGIVLAKAGEFGARNNYTFGDLGEVYGAQWRHWTGITNTPSGGYARTIVVIDQIKKVIDAIKKNPFGRRHIVSAWNPAEVDNMALPPCHLLFQFNCRPLTRDERVKWWENKTSVIQVGDAINFHDGHDYTPELDSANIPKFYIDCALTQRSADSFLGVPFNIASYGLLTEVVAKMCNMVAGEFIWNGNDTHIYSTHEDAVKEQLSREPMRLCTLKISDRVKSFQDISELTIDDLSIENYKSHPSIKAELSVGV